MHRYALYYAPAADSLLARFGAAILGYDAATGADVPHRVPADVEDWPAATAEPRKYGFHATLKAPFLLADGVTRQNLEEGMAAFAAATSPVVLDGLAVTSIGPFCALTPVGDPQGVNDLASRAVEAFDRFRAPVTPADRERRLKSPLTERQIRYLDDWGYPYVHEEFRFHMTLTGPLHADIRDGVRSGLTAAYAEAVPAGPVAVDQIVLFHQAPGERFRIVARAAFSG
jgi:putative phosphonate metabolism protein